MTAEIIAMAKRVPRELMRYPYEIVNFLWQDGF